jgi:hypothetical protein
VTRPVRDKGYQAFARSNRSAWGELIDQLTDRSDHGDVRVFIISSNIVTFALDTALPSINQTIAQFLTQNSSADANKFL